MVMKANVMTVLIRTKRSDFVIFPLANPFLKFMKTSRGDDKRQKKRKLKKLQ